LLLDEYGAIGVCRITKKRGLLPVQIEQNSVQEVINFITYLPNGWQHLTRDGSQRLIPGAPPKYGKPWRFDHMMEIYHPRCQVRFQAYFDTDLRYLCLFTHPDQVRGYSMEFDGITFEYKSRGQVLEIRMPRNDNLHHSADHPIVELCHRALGAQRMHIIRPSVCRLFPQVEVDRWRRLELTRAAHQGLKRKLEELCPGSTRFYFREAASHLDLIPLARGEKDPQKLFGLTWIFPWAASIIKHVRPSCLILDGTFESVKPYTLEVIEAVIANEAIPIGLGIAPSESELSYLRLWDHLAEALGEGGAEILRRIPLLSDRGPALGALARAKGLRWLWCHRHLIENAGASSIGGDWVRRLLAAGSLGEAKDVAKAIKAEMAILEARRQKLFRREDSRALLIAMLAAVDHNRESNLRFWARWMRLRCPTTTNAGESIHAQLNLATRFARSFYQRLSAVKDYLWRRFEERDSRERRGRRSVNKWCSPKMAAKVTEGNWTFYMYLHSFDQGEGRGLRFCDFSWAFPEVHWTQESTVEWQLVTEDPPDGWIQDVPCADAEGGDSQFTDTRGRSGGQGRPGTPAYLQTGWQIYRTAKLISGCRKNERRAVEATVWAAGGQFQGQNSISAQDQLRWRINVYTALNLLGPVPISP
jgi:hypothetical protein